MKFAMYYGFCEMLRDSDIEQTIAYLKKFGLDGVELIFSGKDPSQDIVGDIYIAQKLREALEKEGIKVSCYSAYCDVFDPDEIPAALKRIEIAKALGSPFFHHTLIPQTSFPIDPEDFAQKLPHTLDCAQRIAEYAQKHGVMCLYEEQGRYINGIKNFGIFFDEIKNRCPNVGVCADFGNIFFAGEKPEDFIAAYIEDIKHVHIKDYHYKSAEECHTAPTGWSHTKGGYITHSVAGEGAVDFEKCLKLLKASGYDGFYSLEICHPEPLDYGIEKATKLLTEIYGKL